MKTKQKFIAIARHELLYGNNLRETVYGIPALIDVNGPLFKLPGAVFELPIEYFLIPVISKPGWDGAELLLETTELVRKTGYDGRVATFTLGMPQLRHARDSEIITCLQLSYESYPHFKQLLGEQIIEVHSPAELIKKFAFHLPEEPLDINIPPIIKSMMAKIPKGPLNGVLVVAFDQQIAGSLAAEELVRKGACVIKVEKFDGGDPKRQNSSPNAFTNFNAGKFGISFDNSEESRVLKQQLLRHADVIIDNRSPSAQRRDLILQNALLNPSRLKPVIFCSISGFGRDSDRTAYDRVIQAESGMADFNGKLIPFPIIDMATGKEAASEIVTQLFMRSSMTPRELAQTPCIRIDVSMISVALAMMSNQVATLIDTGRPESTIVPFDLYPTQNGKISVAVAKDEQYAKLCEIIGAQSIIKYNTNAKRLTNKAEVEQIIRERLLTQKSEHWLELFASNGIPAGPVISLTEALAVHGASVVKATVSGQIIVGSPSASNIHPQHPSIGGAPQHNEHRPEVAELLNYLESHNSKAGLIRSTHNEATDHSVDFRRNYRFVDVHEIKFTSQQKNPSWANGPIFTVRKTGEVTARQAKPYEIIEVKHTDKTTGTQTLSKIPAMPGDWVLTTKFGDQHILPAANFSRNYTCVDGETFKPNPDLPPRHAVKITENICFMSPSGDPTYIPKGGWLVQGSKSAYGIHPNNIAGNYEVAKWTSLEVKRWSKVGSSEISPK